MPESRDISLRGIAVALAIILTGVAASVGSAWIVVRGFAGSATSPQTARSAPPRLPPAPGPRTAPRPDLERFRAEKEARLTSYGWVDRKAGRVHIPIEQAMARLVAERGGKTEGGARRGDER
jgi:hypothetical protein